MVTTRAEWIAGARPRTLQTAIVPVAVGSAVAVAYGHFVSWRALLAVFVFFGVMAVAGTAYVQLNRLPWLAVAAALPIGLLACALLVINNLRDIPSDAAAGKRTLAVVLGDRRTRLLYTVCVLVPFGA